MSKNIQVRMNGQLPEELIDQGIKLRDVAFESKKVRFSGNFRVVPRGSVVKMEEPGSMRGFLYSQKIHGEPIETAEEFLALIASAKKKGLELPETIVIRSVNKGKILCFANDEVRELNSPDRLTEGAAIAYKAKPRNRAVVAA